jgi:hypothetical protein
MTDQSLAIHSSKIELWSEKVSVLNEMLAKTKVVTNKIILKFVKRPMSFELLKILSSKFSNT